MLLESQDPSIRSSLESLLSTQEVVCGMEETCFQSH